MYVTAVHTTQFITSREEIDEEYQRRLRQQQMKKGGKSAKQDTGVYVVQMMLHCQPPMCVWRHVKPVNLLITDLVRGFNNGSEAGSIVNAIQCCSELR